MHFVAILNRGGGTLKTTDLDALSQTMRDVLGEHGHTVEVVLSEPSEIVAALEKAARSRKADIVLAGGGDGTISAAAATLMNSRKALAVLPAGTMNLFARGLSVPLALDEAIKAFATGEVRAVDIATANGRPFVHQFSIGMHAKLVALREKMDFGSRLGKIRASTRAAVGTILAPPSMNVTLMLDEEELFFRTTGVGVTNNLFGEGTLPFAEVPDGGMLGVYVTRARRTPELILFFANVVRGRWSRNPKVDILQARRVVVKVSNRGRRRRCVMDGELCELEPETEIVIHPGALNVLVPARPES
jgi:diacylglycerol kinase family enzyme